jgi:hypothetical protein
MDAFSVFWYQAFVRTKTVKVPAGSLLSHSESHSSIKTSPLTMKRGPKMEKWNLLQFNWTHSILQQRYSYPKKIGNTVLRQLFVVEHASVE